MPETMNFDPADFDRRLNALLEIATSQSASIHELAESVKEQGRQIEEQGRQLKTTERLVREMVDGINRLANVAEAHGEVLDDREQRLNRLEGETPSNGTPE